MKGDFHVRFCENKEVKFFCVTRLREPGLLFAFIKFIR